MLEVRTTPEFDQWMSKMRDLKARARIFVRIDRIERGNLGDHRSVGDEVHELRFTFGPGYRVYFTKRGNEIIFLLCGGDKGSQVKDIERAKKLAKEIE